jgi:hypothetical protein
MTVITNRRLAEISPARASTPNKERNEALGMSCASMSQIATKTSTTAILRGKKGHFCRPLEAQFRHGGFDYRQIAREGDKAIYQQRWPGSGNACY